MSVEVRLFFNFRSPYCYLASKTLFLQLERFDIDFLWRPLAGGHGRSAPDRARLKVPLTRQDVARWCKRMQIPYEPPPTSTDPTPAALGSLAAERAGLLRPYVEVVMHEEWGRGKDIGSREVLDEAAQAIGLDLDALHAALDSPNGHARLEAHWAEAQALGVIGVPSFVIGDQVFWGNDRLDFVIEHLTELGAAKG